MTKVRPVILPAESPTELGLEGDPLRFRVWANAPKSVMADVWNVYDAEKRAAAFHALLRTSEPQTLETDDSAVTLDFRTPEAARETLALDLPDDIASWIVNLPDAARTMRREKIGDLLPLSFGSRSS